MKSLTKGRALADGLKQVEAEEEIVNEVLMVTGVPGLSLKSEGKTGFIASVRQATDEDGTCLWRTGAVLDLKGVKNRLELRNLATHVLRSSGLSASSVATAIDGITGSNCCLRVAGKRRTLLLSRFGVGFEAIFGYVQ